MKAGENTEIIEDWSLHPAAEVETSLTVGSGWRREEYSESLQLAATDLLEPGMEMVTISRASQVTSDGDNVDNLNQLVRQVDNLNTWKFPRQVK